MLGKVTITQDNNNAGGIAEVERKVLFIGAGGASAVTDTPHAINQQSELDALLGSEASPLKTNILAALANGGPNFTGYAIALGALAWDQALEMALDMPHDLDVEIVAITDPVAVAEDIDSMQAAAVSAGNTWAKLISIHAATAGITGAETWASYLSAQSALVNGKACHRVCLVPQLHGNNLGVVIGRLVNDAVSIADSPMRVRSGAVIGLGPAPSDTGGVALTMAHIETLANARFSVPQWYTGKDGIYWADHMTLDSDGSDFQVYENLRVIDYVTRRVRVLAINKIADRSLNGSDSSIAFHQAYFMQPIFQAAKATVINGEMKPGIVQQPADGDITIQWNSATEVELWMLAAPVNSAKKIKAHISLDLTRI
jgi:hypothetical protein